MLLRSEMGGWRGMLLSETVGDGKEGGGVGNQSVDGHGGRGTDNSGVILRTGI
jgi:hypothetical protein